VRPVTPQPGYVEADTDALLASRQFVFADCYTITLVDGVTRLRYTTGQEDVSVVPIGDLMRVTYRAKQVQISGLRFKIGIGVEVDEQTVTLSYTDDDLIQGQNFALALKIGWLDGATITRDRFFAAAWGDPWIGGIPMFAGRVSTLDNVGRVQAKIKVKSALVLLNVDMPRLLWQPSCVNTLGDINCGVDQNLFATTVPLVVDATPTVLPWAGATADYNLGKVYIENFDSVTRVRTIREVQVGVSVTLSYPLDFIPVAGNQFVAYEGCDRTIARCPHFGGSYLDRNRSYPFVPVGETAA
jgi:hypothetical protein